MTSFAFPVQRAIRIGESGRVEAIWPEAIFRPVHRTCRRPSTTPGSSTGAARTRSCVAT
ncbi:MAG: hypothetical protein MZW92_10685 [Comamonadaceae bacterium]|nr:hypothetical protein [Comamonadaceae bacterium]